MSKHSLISTVAGLGLMAASMGVSAQSSMTFDYSMMFYGNATGGGKYIAFVPTSARAMDAVPAEVPGAQAVLMLDLFQPATGSASTWAYAVGGPVGLVAAGAAASDSLDVGFGSAYLHGSNNSIEMSFAQAVVVSSQACNVTFNAQVDTNNQLRFTDIGAAPSGALSATGRVDYKYALAGASSSTIAATDWNAGSASLALPTGAVEITAGLATNPVGTGTPATTAFTNRNKCVAAYTSRAQGGATVIGPGGPVTLGMTRIW